MSKVITIKIEKGEVEVSDEDGVIMKASFRRLRNDDIYCFFLGHLADGLKICRYIDISDRYEPEVKINVRRKLS